jgi:cobalt-zinc-cadmium efflux system protein
MSQRPSRHLPHDHAEHEREAGHGHAHEHGHGGHSHEVSADADRRYLAGALVLITGYMLVEVVVGLMAGSLALISDAGHMLSDAASIVLALFAMTLAARPPRGGYTFGLKRAEILSAQANGLSLLLLAGWFTYEGIHRLIEPTDVRGALVLSTASVGIVINIAAAWLLSRANRSSLNVEGAFQHILNDLYAFIATAISGLIVWTTGFARADAIAALFVAVLMAQAGAGLVRASGRILLEAAPAGIDPDEVGADLAAHADVTEVHDLHIWTVTSGYPALTAHVLVRPESGCHAVRSALEARLTEKHGISHTTLQVDHAIPETLTISDTFEDDRTHCADPHGTVHRHP